MLKYLVFCIRMGSQKADIIAALQREILLLEGFKPASSEVTDNAGLNIIRNAFPNKIFPEGAIHEFICNSNEDITVSAAFICGITASLMKKNAPSVWITSTQNIFPPALTQFGIQPHNIIFIRLQKEREKLWAMEEALKCDALATVIAEIKDLSFTDSRRFQLAVERSKVTGLLLRLKPKNFATAAVTRWKISSAITPSNEIPGVNFPAWNVELVKVRNGKAASWQMEWKQGFKLIREKETVIKEVLRKIV
jgi:protein ImuA